MTKTIQDRANELNAAQFNTLVGRFTAFKSNVELFDAVKGGWVPTLRTDNLTGQKRVSMLVLREKIRRAGFKVWPEQVPGEGERSKERKAAELRIWKKTSKDFRGMWEGERSILVNSHEGTCLAKLSNLSDEEIAKRDPQTKGA